MLYYFVTLMVTVAVFLLIIKMQRSTWKFTEVIVIAAWSWLQVWSYWVVYINYHQFWNDCCYIFQMQIQFATEPAL